MENETKDVEESGEGETVQAQGIAEQAAAWLLELRAEPGLGSVARRAAFVEWIRRGPTHLMVFMEMVELERRFKRLDKTVLARIQEALKQEVSSNP